MHHKQFTNPAAMGAEDAFNFATYTQLRLYGFDSAPVQTALQVTVPFSTNINKYSLSEVRKNMYIGFTTFISSIGVKSNYDFLASYGYKVSFLNTYLTFSIALGVDVNNTNYQKLLQDYDHDPVLTTLRTSTKYKLQGQAGGYLQGNKYYFSLYSSSIVENRNIYLQAGFFSTVGKSDDDGYSMTNADRKSLFEINGQLGYANNAIILQANTMFTLNNLVGMGVVWEYPLKMAGMASFNLGLIKISYAYHIDNLDRNLPTHEIFLKIKVKPKTDAF
jgi:hypothetical protein